MAYYLKNRKTGRILKKKYRSYYSVVKAKKKKMKNRVRR